MLAGDRLHPRARDLDGERGEARDSEALLVVLGSDCASTLPLATCTESENRISRRRSVMSASTPAGSENRNIGRNTAVCTSAARKDEPVSSTIIQAAAMVCIALPTK